MSGKRCYLVCYDIRDPERLARIGRFIAGQAVRVQYSVYLVERDSRTLAQLIEDLVTLIDARVDDLRIYPLPRQIDLETLGTSTWPHQCGIHLDTLLISPTSGSLAEYAKALAKPMKPKGKSKQAVQPMPRSQGD